MGVFAWLSPAMQNGRAPVDPLGPDFESRVRAAVQKCDARRAVVTLGARGPASAIRRFVGGEAGKETYIQFLKDRYGYAIARVNQEYGLDATSFTELAQRDFHETDETKPTVKSDDVEFEGVARAYWERWVREARQRCGMPEQVGLKLAGEELEIVLVPMGARRE